jgi:hypothetical protein
MTASFTGKMYDYKKVHCEVVRKVCTAAAVYFLRYNLRTLAATPPSVNWVPTQNAKTFDKVAGEGVRFLKEHSHSVLVLDGIHEEYMSRHVEDDVGVRATRYIMKNQEFWPSMRPDDFDVKIRVFNLTTASGRSISERVFCTQLSEAQPLHSLFAFLNTHLTFTFHPLQTYAAAEVLVFDPIERDAVVFELLNQVTNDCFARMLTVCRNRDRLGVKSVADARGLQSAKRNRGKNSKNKEDDDRNGIASWWNPSTATIDVVLAPDGEGKYPRFRQCHPAKLCLGDVKSQNIVAGIEVAIPEGATLRHLRQIIRDECVVQRLTQQESDSDGGGVGTTAAGVVARRGREAAACSSDTRLSGDRDDGDEIDDDSEGEYSEGDAEDERNMKIERLRIEFARKSHVLISRLDKWIAMTLGVMENKMKFVNAGKEVVCELVVRQSKKHSGMDLLDKDEDGNKIFVSAPELIDGTYMPEEISFLEKAMFSVSATRRGRLVETSRWLQDREKTLQDRALVEDARRKMGTNVLRGKYPPTRIQALFDRYKGAVSALVFENIFVYELLYSVEAAGVVLASMGLGLGKGGVASIPVLDALLPGHGDAANDQGKDKKKGAGPLSTFSPSGRVNGSDHQKLLKRLENAKRSGEQVITLDQFKDWAGYDEKVTKLFRKLSDPKRSQKSVKIPLVLRARFFDMGIVRHHLDLSKATALEEFQERARHRIKSVMTDYAKKSAKARYLRAQHRKARIMARTLNQSHVEELVRRGSTGNFLFLHHGRKVAVEREAGILALVNAVDSGAIGMRSNHEQNARLLVQLEPANGIVFDRLGLDEEGLSSDVDSSEDTPVDFVQDSDSDEEIRNY